MIRSLPYRSMGMLSCIIVVALAACGPSPSRSVEPGGVSPEQPARTKTLTVALQRELTSFGDFAGANVGGNAPEVRHFAHDMLVEEDYQGVWRPRLAQEQIAVDKGTWRLNPDGPMDVTWHIRPNVKWQDGTPFTSADLVFTLMLYKDPELPSIFSPHAAMMASATAPDPQTLTVHWAQVYAKADQAPALYPLPRHLLEELYTQDKASFVNSPRFTTEWVGLGPYQLVRWDAGSMMEFTRFDGYHQGRPPLDRLIVQYIRDSNTMLANFLAGTVDVIPPANVDVDTAVELTQRFEGTGDRVRMDPTSRLELLEFQMRPEFARPRNGVTSRLVRQALYYGTDRQVLAEILNRNLAPVTDHWFPPGHPLLRDVAPAVPSYPYDQNRALRLLAEAGWFPRGADGTLVSAADGERFQVEIYARAGTAGLEKEIQVVADQWRGLGIQATPFPIPAALSADREFQTKYPGVLAAFPSADSLYEIRLHSRYTSAAENRWTGQNRAGYNSPRVDQLIDAITVTIEPREQVRLHRELAQEVFTDLPFIPVTWDVYPILILRGVKGDPSAVNSGWNIFEWDKET